MTTEQPVTALSTEGCVTAGLDNPSRTPWHYAHAAGIEGLHWDIYAGEGADGWLVASVGTEADAARIVEAVNRDRAVADYRASPCRYCGSVNGATPPLTGAALRGAIDAACSLTNPRLSEVDWDAVAATFDGHRPRPATVPDCRCLRTARGGSRGVAKPAPTRWSSTSEATE